MITRRSFPRLAHTMLVKKTGNEAGFALLIIQHKIYYYTHTESVCADDEVLKVTAAVIWRGVISSKLSPRLGHIMVKSGHTGFSAAEVSFWEHHHQPHY